MSLGQVNYVLYRRDSTIVNSSLSGTYGKVCLGMLFFFLAVFGHLLLFFWFLAKNCSATTNLRNVLTQGAEHSGDTSRMQVNMLGRHFLNAGPRRCILTSQAPAVFQSAHLVIPFITRSECTGRELVA